MVTNLEKLYFAGCLSPRIGLVDVIRTSSAPHTSVSMSFGSLCSNLSMWDSCVFWELEKVDGDWPDPN